MWRDSSLVGGNIVSTDTVARAPSASSVLAPTEAGPSLIRERICAEGPQRASRQHGHDTTSLTSSVAGRCRWRGWRRRKRRVSSPAMSADLAITMPLPDNAPVSADALRPGFEASSESTACLQASAVPHSAAAAHDAVSWTRALRAIHIGALLARSRRSLPRRRFSPDGSNVS